MIIQLGEGIRPRDYLEYLRSLGFVRVIFPAHEYGKPNWTVVGEEETRRLNWAGDDGYAERFLARRNDAIWHSRLTRDS